MPEPITLEQALIDACAFAVKHHVDSTITPSDFGVRHSDDGRTSATYVDACFAVTVDIDARGVTFGVAELNWVHFPDPEDADDQDCTTCHPDDGRPTHLRGVRLETVYLPGDAPIKRAANV